MKKTLRFVGLDVHKDTIVIAVADQGRDGEVRVYGTISSAWHAVEHALSKLRAGGAELRVAYEAGPTGFGLYRQLRKMHIECLVVAPSKMPVPGGRRQKNDRRDAELLARLLRAGELTAIHVPDEVDESIRDLTRARGRRRRSAARKATAQVFPPACGFPLHRQGRLGREAPAVSARPSTSTPAKASATPAGLAPTTSSRKTAARSITPSPGRSPSNGSASSSAVGTPTRPTTTPPTCAPSRTAIPPSTSSP